MICKWNGRDVCRLSELKGINIFDGSKIEPFTYCDDDIACEKMHCSCQPTTMGYMSQKDYLDDKINDKRSLNYWVNSDGKT